MKRYKYRANPSKTSVLENITELAEDAGFLYDPGQDIFYSAMNPWQKKYGYTRLYDEAAALFGMVIDCEPIRFQYNGRMWLIEFWKGQYGISTGAEIGVYSAEYNSAFGLPPEDLLYSAASGENRLEMAYELVRDGSRLFFRRDKHWWLTGFVLGKFSEPSQLKMRIKITMKDKEMLDAFVSALRLAGYNENQFRTSGEHIKILFNRPHAPQPVSRTGLIGKFTQIKNKVLCFLFNRFGSFGINMLSHTVLFGRPEKFYTSCRRKRHDTSK